MTRVLNLTKGNVVCEQTELASNPFTRMRGLLGRAGLDQGAGMLFRGESSIHSAFMRFQFDAIFMDRELRVVKVAENIKPWRALGAKGSANILELSGGEITRLGIAVGDQLEVSDQAATPDAGSDD